MLLTDAATDDSLRAIHIRGGGKRFLRGRGLGGHQQRGQRPRTGDLVRRIPHTANRVIELVHGIQLPVVCSVQGWAVGLGCNLALAADFTVAADDAVFWEPFVGPRLLPGFWFHVAAAPARRRGAGQGDAAARREGEWKRRCGLGTDPPLRELGPNSTTSPSNC